MKGETEKWCSFYTLDSEFDCFSSKTKKHPKKKKTFFSFSTIIFQLFYHLAVEGSKAKKEVLFLGWKRDALNPSPCHLWGSTSPVTLLSIVAVRQHKTFYLVDKVLVDLNINILLKWKQEEQIYNLSLLYNFYQLFWTP